jgi:protein SCO1/2
MGGDERRWRVRAPVAALFWAAGRSARASKDADRPRPADARTAVEAARLPAPGSYVLPRLQRAPNGEVLGPDAKAHHLHRLLAGRFSVLTFMYSYCRDPVGCPLAWKIMETVHDRLHAEPALAARTQLVSLSFDPTNDTPLQMAGLGGERLRDPRVRWLFLTTASVPRLMPLLEGFGQDVTVETDAQGRPTRTLNHLLKIFLVDRALQVREIYGVATVSPEVILNDLRSLQLEAGGLGGLGPAQRWRR